MKQALVTGGTSGIGLGIVQAFLDAGYGVTAAGIDDGAQLPQHPHLSFARVDVTQDADTAASIAGLARLDALVNCAGIILRGGQEFTAAGFQKVIDVNLTGTMRMCLAAKDVLAASNGAIVNIASLWSTFGAPLNPAYTASKGGIAQLTKSLAVAWAPDIRVNAVAPGWIETALSQAAHDDPARNAAILARTPMGRWGTPGDVAGAVLFLCSDAARFITGTVLPVDGGYLAK